VVYSEPLDSRIYRCPWHRVVLHAHISAGAQVQVDTLTAESPKELAELLALPETRWTTGQIDSQVGDGLWDCLIQAPPGRYLWLRLTLSGGGTTTPAIRAIEVDYPRASPRQYLPAVYSEDAPSADFLDRFLSIFDRFWQGLSERIGGLPAYFDPLATPAGAPDGDFLSWLAGWLGLSFDRNWPVEKRRRLLANAHRLYALRGTPAGLKLHIELFTGMEPQVLEHFKLRRWLYLNAARLGSQSELWGADIVNRLQLDAHARLDEVQLIDSGDPLHDPFYHYAHQFTVFVPTSEEQRPILERIIEMARPAHAQGHLRLVQPRLRIGIQACIGVDTVIGQYPAGVALAGPGPAADSPPARDRLGYDTILGPAPDEDGAPTMRTGKNTRIGAGTLLD
jgi:phage tail-like protein